MTRANSVAGPGQHSVQYLPPVRIPRIPTNPNESQRVPTSPNALPPQKDVAGRGLRVSVTCNPNPITRTQEDTADRGLRLSFDGTIHLTLTLSPTL